MGRVSSTDVSDDSDTLNLLCHLRSKCQTSRTSGTECTGAITGCRWLMVAVDIMQINTMCSVFASLVNCTTSRLQKLNFGVDFSHGMYNL